VVRGDIPLIWYKEISRRQLVDSLKNVNTRSKPPSEGVVRVEYKEWAYHTIVATGTAACLRS